MMEEYKAIVVEIQVGPYKDWKSVGYFRDTAKAQQVALLYKHLEVRIRELTIWKDNEKWYLLGNRQEIMVDLPTKKEVLAKLTNYERYVLGL